MSEKWGWTSYQRTCWVREDGKRLYLGHFRTDDNAASLTWATARLYFWASRPILALRAIVDSGRNPTDFHEQVVN